MPIQIKSQSQSQSQSPPHMMTDGVEVAMSDLRRMKHEEMIERMFDIVVNKYKDLKKNVDDNPHLVEVLKKYKKYIEDKINLYEAQLEVFHNILKYLKEEESVDEGDETIDSKMIKKEFVDVAEKLKKLRRSLI